MTDQSLEPGASGTRTELVDGIGPQLARARESMNWSSAEVAQRLCMSIKQIEAIESQRWHEFANMSILRAFVRSYAKLLNLNPDTLTSALPLGKQETASLIYSPSVSVPLPGQGLSHKAVRWLLYFFLILIVLGLISSAFWVYWQADGKLPRARQSVEAIAVPAPPVTSTKQTLPEPDTAPVSPIVAMVPPPAEVKPVVVPPVSPTATNSPQLSLKFSEECWIEIFHDGNKVLARGLQPGGSELSFNGKPPFRLLIGNAKAVSLRYKGQSVDLTTYTGDKVARLTLE